MGGWWAGFSAAEEVKGESHMAPSLLQGVWTSCRAAPCQELSGDGWKEGRRQERKKEKEREGEEHRQARERWSVVLPEEEAWMTQASGFCNQKRRREEETYRGEESERDRKSWERGREGEADMQATEESGNTPTFVT